jgi:hypothetical protein
MESIGIRILNFRIIILESPSIENRISQVILRAYFYRFGEITGFIPDTIAPISGIYALK